MSVAISAPPPTALSAERYRRIIVRMTELLFILVPLEGILRKWILPQIEQPLLFIRDPVMLAIIGLYLAFRGGRLPPLALAFLATTIALLCLSTMQALLGASPISALIGLRFYLLFVPLLFIIPDTFDNQDIAALLRLVLVLAVPTAVLVVAQFYSPVAAPINKGLSDDVADRFLVVAGVVRPYGPFTFTLGLTTFATLATAVLLIALNRPSPIIAGTLLLLISSAAVLVTGALSGSRTYFVSSAIVVALASIGAFLLGLRTRHFGALWMLLLVLAAFSITFFVVLPQAADTMLARQLAAQASEGSLFDRIASIVTDVTRVMDVAPLFGYGIGAGSNAASYLSTGQRAFALAEYEWTRIVPELGPACGMIVIGLRIWLCVHLLWESLKAAGRGHSSPLVLAGFCAPLLFIGQITGNNLMVTLPWLWAGVVLAMLRQIKTTS